MPRPRLEKRYGTALYDTHYMKQATITDPIDRAITRNFIEVAKWADCHVLVSDRRLARETGTQQLCSGRHEGYECLAVAIDVDGATYLMRTGKVVQIPDSA